MNQEKFKKILIARREELEGLLEESSDSSKPVELDQTTQGRLSRMDAMQLQAMAVETKRRRENEISQIISALARIEEDEYGYCISCGEEISEKRLELNPSALNCINCAK